MESPAERIMICVDCCEEPYVNRYPVVEGGKPYSTLGIAKKCAEAFITNKAALNSKHQFSLLVLKASSQRCTTFTSNVHSILNTLKFLNSDSVPEQPLPLSRIFETAIDSGIRNSELDDIRPLRLIILFSRQGSCHKDEAVPAPSGDLIVDIIYLHKPLLSAKEKKRTEMNLNELQSCVGEHSICSIALACTYNAFICMAQLLIHPQLRK